MKALKDIFYLAAFIAMIVGAWVTVFWIYGQVAVLR